MGAQVCRSCGPWTERQLMEESLLPEPTVIGDVEYCTVGTLLDEPCSWDDTPRFWRGLPLALVLGIVGWSMLALVAYAVYRFLT